MTVPCPTECPVSSIKDTTSCLWCRGLAIPIPPQPITAFSCSEVSLSPFILAISSSESSPVQQDQWEIPVESPGQILILIILRFELCCSGPQGCSPAQSWMQGYSYMTPSSLTHGGGWADKSTFFPGRQQVLFPPSFFPTYLPPLAPL